MSLAPAIKSSRALLCIECGKCTGVCPVSKFNRGYSPRILINKSLRGANSDLLKDKNIWACLTCKLCDEQCPADIDYVALTQAIRFEAQKLGEEAICSHGGAAQSLMRIMTAPSLRPNRMAWLDKDLKVADTGRVLYFVGCAPYFDTLFSDIGVVSTRSAQSTIKVLNHLGITPVVLPQERCCGHDLLWAGDFENFKKLAEFNMSEFRKAGIEKIVFSCPECYRTFRLDYLRYFDFKIETLHITELLSEAIDGKRIALKESKRTVTFQDPCRLGRHLGIFDAPRKALTAIPNMKLEEMTHTRNRAICCGVSAWMNCSFFSKRIQTMRLKEAKATGADLFVLSCPKCEIHFNCAMKELEPGEAAESYKIETVNLVTLIAELLKE